MVLSEALFSVFFLTSPFSMPFCPSFLSRPVLLFSVSSILPHPPLSKIKSFSPMDHHHYSCTKFRRLFRRPASTMMIFLCPLSPTSPLFPFSRAVAKNTNPAQRTEPGLRQKAKKTEQLSARGGGGGNMVEEGGKKKNLGTSSNMAVEEEEGKGEGRAVTKPRRKRREGKKKWRGKQRRRSWGREGRGMDCLLLFSLLLSLTRLAPICSCRRQERG